MNSMQTGFDWEKNKPYQIKKTRQPVFAGGDDV